LWLWTPEGGRAVAEIIFGLTNPFVLNENIQSLFLFFSFWKTEMTYGIEETKAMIFSFVCLQFDSSDREDSLLVIQLTVVTLEYPTTDPITVRLHLNGSSEQDSPIRNLSIQIWFYQPTLW
jgi:hypothetical protein